MPAQVCLILEYVIFITEYELQATLRILYETTILEISTKYNKFTLNSEHFRELLLNLLWKTRFKNKKDLSLFITMILL
jgi:hypothetical protein